MMKNDRENLIEALRKPAFQVEAANVSNKSGIGVLGRLWETARLLVGGFLLFMVLAAIGEYTGLETWIRTLLGQM